MPLKTIENGTVADAYLAILADAPNAFRAFSHF